MTGSLPPRAAAPGQARPASGYVRTAAEIRATVATARRRAGLLFSKRGRTIAEGPAGGKGKIRRAGGRHKLQRVEEELQRPARAQPPCSSPPASRHSASA